MESQKAFNIIKGYISRYLAKENQYFIDPQQILSIAREYFTDYFGKENEALIAERLGKTDLSFVNRKNCDKVARKSIKNCNSFLLEKDNEVLGISDRSEIFGAANLVASYDLAGQCVFIAREDRNTDKLIDVRHCAFVRDLESTEYEEKPSELPFTDVIICHELLHAVTQHIANNSMQSGVYRYDGDDTQKMEINEWLIDSMAHEIVRKLYDDGIVFNKLGKRSESIFNLDPVISTKLRTIQEGFLKNYKNVLKPAMLMGNFDELHDALGGKKRFNKKLRKKFSKVLEI